MSFVTADDSGDELTDLEKVDGLRRLIITELATCMTIESSDYVVARIASYVFVLDAIERRWPQFADWTDIRDELVARMS